MDETCPECGESFWQIYAKHLQGHLTQSTELKKEFNAGQNTATIIAEQILTKIKTKKTGKKAFDKKTYMREYWKKRKEKFKKKGNLPEVLERLEKIDKKRKAIAAKMPKTETKTGVETK